MQHSGAIPIVDLFAGPGGLGEGFSALDGGKTFEILVSAEMDAAAHKTLQLRSYFRQLKREGTAHLSQYYKFCNGESESPVCERTNRAWLFASEEALLLTLGTEKGNLTLEKKIHSARLSADTPWVLIGGPPCQAYSLVGRSRNRGKKEYLAEADHRHFLYREYLRIIQKFSPAVFVMENVKGILSSKVSNNYIFPTILRDLTDPHAALGKSGEVKYKIFSIATACSVDHLADFDELDVTEFVVRAENFGLPQARHRVILIGVRQDIDIAPNLLEQSPSRTFTEVTYDLPKIRSRLSKQHDSPSEWRKTVASLLDSISAAAKKRPELQELHARLLAIPPQLQIELGTGGVRIPMRSPSEPNMSLGQWYPDRNLKCWLNHEARGHMASDLKRYLFAAAFSETYGRPPKGPSDFSLSGLKPAHKNWESGKFSDRFRVQLPNRPSTTITSHIAKDGHYFIHPDPSQCRSLTVREAARLQTFPDNYFFQGNRTQQFAQVGNAVPPYLALQIAKIVKGVLK